MSISRSTLKIFVIVMMFSAGTAYAGGGTAFTYQGRLLDAGEPANGTFNIDFSLWNDPAAGSQVDSTITFNNLPITDGLFTVELDFGANAFDNAGRWLEISVAGVPLLPRQPITRSPYSIQTRGIFVDEAGDATVDGTISAAEFVGPVNAANLTGTIDEARLPQNAIDGSEIEDETLTGADIADNSLTGNDLRGVFNAGEGSKPFHFQRYGPFGNGGTLTTQFSGADWIAAVVGFRTFNGDIQENGVGNPIYCYPFQENGIWKITFDFRSHNTHEGWEVWVMFVDRRMATINGF